MSEEPEIERDRDGIRELLYRLRPGDEVAVATHRGWSGGSESARTMRIEKVVLEPLSDGGEEYYRIFGKGRQQQNRDGSGSYVLMPEKPAGKGNHPAPEAYHRSSDPDADYRERTGGAITGLELRR
jgi:hypothetical protein